MAKTRKINRTYSVIKPDPLRVKPSYKSKKKKTLAVGTKVRATRLKGHYIYVPALKGWTIWKDSKGVKYVKLVKNNKQTKATKLLASLKKIAAILKKHPIKWSNSPGTSSLAATLKKNRINCACYISYGLQDIGVLPKNVTFWLDGKVHGKGASYLRKKGKITHPKVVPSKAKLKKGDICGFAKAPHTMVYAGKDKKGHLLWYSAGGSDTRPKNYGPKRKKAYEKKKVMTKIRLK